MGKPGNGNDTSCGRVQVSTRKRGTERTRKAYYGSSALPSLPLRQNCSPLLKALDLLHPQNGANERTCESNLSVGATSGKPCVTNKNQEHHGAASANCADGRLRRIGRGGERPRTGERSPPAKQNRNSRRIIKGRHGAESRRMLKRESRNLSHVATPAKCHGGYAKRHGKNRALHPAFSLVCVCEGARMR